tara:strand:- start:1084 stop:1632 length:549 start_codon:yes stop_codon:yes gene_type:complete
MSYNLTQLLARAQDLAHTGTSADDAEIAGIALALSACRAGIDTALEPLKNKLRTIGRLELNPEDLGQEVVVDIEGDVDVRRVLDSDRAPRLHRAGMVSVTYQASRVKVTKGTEERALRKLLGSQFDLYFETRVSVVPRREFQEVVERRKGGHPVEITAVLGHVEVFEPTPRVGFKPSRAVEP